MNICKRTTLNVYSSKSGTFFISVNGRFHQIRPGIHSLTLPFIIDATRLFFVTSRWPAWQAAAIRKNCKLYTSIIVHGDGSIFRDGKRRGKLSSDGEFSCLIPK
jgi:hypothetical protein